MESTEHSKIVVDDDQMPQKSEINFILEGMVLNQILSILNPCFDVCRFEENPSPLQACEIENPSSTIPHESEGQCTDDNPMNHHVEKKKGMVISRPRSPKIDIFVARKLAVLISLSCKARTSIHHPGPCHAFAKLQVWINVHKERNLLSQRKAQCDAIIEQYANRINIPQHHLMITYNSKGLVHGRLRIYTDSSNFVSCDGNPDQGMLIPSIVYEGDRSVFIRNPKRTDGVPEGQHTVLIVEKATVFQRLISMNLVAHSQNTLTIVTGCGYPDLPTRRFIALCHKADFRILGIADCDPFGIEIMSIYKWGSISHRREERMLAAPSLHWVGLMPQEMGNFEGSLTLGAHKNPLLPIDKRKLDSVINRLERIDGNDALDWLVQAQLMRELDCKCELEILHVKKNARRIKYYFLLIHIDRKL